MPLSDKTALLEWRANEVPSAAAWATVEAWVNEAGEASWRAPSAPYSDVMRPDYEVRFARLDTVDGIVEVLYSHEYATDDVGLLWVGFAR